MIVDSHVHLWQKPADLALRVDEAGQSLRRLAADVADNMEAVQPFDAALIWGFASEHLGAEVPINFLGQHLGLQGRRLVGIAGIDPAGPAWRDKLTEAIDEWGFRGITVCPSCQDMHPLDSRYLALYEVCVERKLPLFFDIPDEWPERANLAYARPDLIDAVAREFPTLKILLSGFGYPHIDETLCLLEKHPTMLTDTAHLANRPLVLSSALARAFEADLLDRVLFGSGFPFAWPRKAQRVVFDQCSHAHPAPAERLPREALEALLHRDALAALGIPRPEGFTERPTAPVETTSDDD